MVVLASGVIINLRDLRITENQIKSNQSSLAETKKDFYQYIVSIMIVDEPRKNLNYSRSFLPDGKGFQRRRARSENELTKSALDVSFEKNQFLTECVHLQKVKIKKLQNKVVQMTKRIKELEGRGPLPKKMKKISSSKLKKKGYRRAKSNPNLLPPINKKRNRRVKKEKSMLKHVLNKTSRKSKSMAVLCRKQADCLHCLRSKSLMRNFVKDLTSAFRELEETLNSSSLTNRLHDIQDLQLPTINEEEKRSKSKQILEIDEVLNSRERKSSFRTFLRSFVKKQSSLESEKKNFGSSMSSSDALVMSSKNCEDVSIIDGVKNIDKEELVEKEIKILYDRMEEIKVGVSKFMLPFELKMSEVVENYNFVV